MVKMDFVSWLHVEAKTFEFLVADGAFILWLEERRRGLSCVVFMGKLCIGWLRIIVEVLVCNTELLGFVSCLERAPRLSLFREVPMGQAAFWR
jgi:hypothetical protein